MALPEDILKEDDNDFFDYAGDILAAPFRGVEGAVQGAYNLADYLSFDVLPDYDTRFLGTSKTMAGGAVEGISQFATGFIPLFGLAGRAGALAKAGTVTKGVVAGAATDFTFFNGQEARLSNLIQQVPELQNPVTEFLAYDEDEGELEGRMKNVLEGLGLEAVAGTFISGLKAIKRGRKAKEEGKDAIGQAQAAVEPLEGGKAVAFAPKPTEAGKSPFTDIRTKLIVDGKVTAIKSLDEDLGQINPVLKKDFYDKTIVEQVASRMQTDNPMTVREALEDLNGRTNGNLGQYTPIVKKLLALGKDTGIDAKLEDRAFASNIPSELPEGSFYESGKRRVVFDGRSAVLRKNPAYVLLHEGTHAVTVDNVNKFFDANSFNKITSTDIAARAKAIDDVLKKDLPKPIAEMFRMFKKADSMRDDIVASGADESLYWIKNPAEFMSMVFSDPRLQEALKGIQYTPKMTMWEKVVNTVKSFFGRGVSTDLANNIVSRVGEIAEMKLPNTKRIGVDMLPEEEISDLDKWYYSDLGKQSDKLLIDQERRVFTMDFTPAVRGKPMLYSELRKRIENAIKEEAYEEAGELQFYLNKANKKIDKHLKKVAKDEGIDLSTIDFAPELPDFKKGKEDEFLTAIPDKFRGFAEALMVGGVRPRLPQFALETDGDVVVLKDLLEKYYEANPEKVTVTDAVTDIDEAIETTVRAQAKEGEDAEKVLRDIRITQQAYREQGKALIQNVSEIAKEAKDNGYGDVSITKLKNAFQQLLTVADVYRRIGRETAITLQARDEGFGKRKLGLSEAETKIEGIRKEFVNNSGGMKPERMVKLVQEHIDPDDLDGSLASLLNTAKKAQGKHFLDMPTEYWMNSILSGPKTQMVNIVGNGLTQVISTLEAVAGGVSTGNMDVVKAVFASWSDWKMFTEAFKFSKKAFKEQDNLLDPANRSFEEAQRGAITGQRVSEAPIIGGMVSDSAKESIDALGNIIRIPSRLLLSTDEFFKQLAYRRAARLKAAMSGIQQGIRDPKALAGHMKKTIDGIVTEGGRMMSEEGLVREATEIANKQGLKGKDKAAFIIKYKDDNFNPDSSTLMQYAAEEAQYLTFTKELQDKTLGKALQDATNKVPYLRLILPFVRTPTNILKFAAERTPAAVLMKEERQRFFEDYKSGDPMRIARANGKILIGGLAAGVMLETVFNNRDNITGGGPSNEREKEALMATGWRPYSIRIGDTYYSYQRLDPIATVLGIAADIVEVGVREEKAFDESGVEHVANALILSLTRNFTNKSYLAGIQMWADALGDPDRYVEKLGRNYAGSFVPNVLSQMADYDSQAIKEVRSITDSVKKKLGLRGSLDTKRNVLGEEYKAEQWMGTGFINPIQLSTKKDDPILNEMASLNHAFRNPPPSLGGQIDMLEYENDKGQSSYDRHLELLKTVKLRGLSLRQSLNKLIKSKAYQRLSPESEPGLESPRIQQINSIRTRYRKEAMRQMLKEYPELDRQFAALTKAKASFRTGMQREDVLELLAQ